MIATDADHRVVRPHQVSGRSDAGRRHGDAGAEAQKADVRLQVVSNHAARQFLRSPGAVEIDRHAAFPLRIAKDVAASKHQGFPFALIDNRAGTDRVPFFVMNLQSHARGEQFLNEFGREVRTARGRRGAGALAELCEANDGAMFGGAGIFGPASAGPDARPACARLRSCS